MSEAIIKLFQQGGGEFISPPSLFIDRLKNIKAVLFDWDGVFNDGTKRGTEGSIFSEIDAMGTNLLRYAFWKKNGALPVTGIITGENNPAAVALGQREHFHEILLLAKNKAQVFSSFCGRHGLKPEQVLFFFDDVLDLEVARQCGMRIMIGRSATPMLTKFVKESALVDYITSHDGGGHGLREGCELVIGLLNLYEAVVKNRMIFSEDYQSYLSGRQEVRTIQM
jgi:3-deoxy-D-manno-octulosonate 8-phosphate phosphatase (KDO 8-P phosphatase)